jgi:hypothetical protein
MSVRYRARRADRKERKRRPGTESGMQMDNSSTGAAVFSRRKARRGKLVSCSPRRSVTVALHLKRQVSSNADYYLRIIVIGTKLKRSN